MQRLWVRWTMLVCFVVVLGTIFFNLGEWQLTRLEQRKERNAATVANEGEPIRNYGEVFDHPITDGEQWQRVEARGTFDADHQFVVRYRSDGGKTGYEIVTPLITEHGAVLVDRGFVALPKGTAIPATAPLPPGGQVQVVGHVRRNEQGRGSATTPSGSQVRLVNSQALGKALPYPLADGYIGLLSVEPAQDGELVPVLPPEISNGPHFWYAVQWFMFTGIAILGVFVFVRGDLRERRQARGQQPLDTPPTLQGSSHGPGSD